MSFSIDDDSVTEPPLVAGYPAHDDYVVGVNLREDWLGPWREAWDVNKLPCLCFEPEHLHGGQILTSFTLPAGNVDLVSKTARTVTSTCDGEVRRRIMLPLLRLQIHKVRRS